MKTNHDRNKLFCDLHTQFEADGLRGIHLRLAVIKSLPISGADQSHRLHNYRAMLDRLAGGPFPWLARFQGPANNKKTKVVEVAAAVGV